mgnify:CR=1 FL=1
MHVSGGFADGIEFFVNADKRKTIITNAITWAQLAIRAVREAGDYVSSISESRVDAVGVRRLTPTGCERLQGFPDGFTEGFSDSIRYRMLGNAVAVPCAEWIARRIIGND